MESMRGPIQHISHPIRVFGLDGTMVLGCLPVIFFPFSTEAWTIAGLNCVAIFIATQMSLPSSQIPRKLISLLRPTVIPPTMKQNSRDKYRPFPY